LKASGEGGLRQIKAYWPLVLILIAIIIVSVIIIYTKVSSPPLFVYYFGETNALGNSSAGSFSPQIATSGNDTYIVWSTKGPVNRVINIDKISNSTSPPSAPFNISNNNANSTNPEVAVSGDNVYLVWRDTNGTNVSSGNIFFSSSSDRGKTYHKPINLSNSGNSTNPEVVAEGNNLYVVWANSQSSGNGEIFLSSSRDKGKSFDEPVNLNNNGNSTDPKIAVSGNSTYVMWSDSSQNNEIKYKQVKLVTLGS
jgi:BNR repeat protein